MRRNDQRLKSYASTNMKGLATALLLSNSGMRQQPSILPSVQALHQTSASHLRMANSIHSQQGLTIDSRQKSDENTFSLAQSLESSEEFQTQGQKEKTKASALSQETIDAAASVSVDENSKSLNNESIDGLETNLESTDAQSISQTTTQEANLINSLNTSEEGSLESTLEQSDELASAQFKSSVDTTLDEIRKLRIIDRELATDAKNEASDAKKKQIDEKGIEESVLKKVKSGKGGHGRIETLVQEQIEDQAEEIEASQTLQESQQALEYGVMVDTAANESEDLSINELEAAAAQERKKLQEKEIIARELEKQRKASESDIDIQNVSHLQSEAAMNDINPTKVVAQVLKKTREPIMPSPESSAVDLGEDYAFKAVKPKIVPKKSQQQLIADVVQKSLKIKERDDKAFKEAQSLFKAKRSQKKEVKAAKKQAKKEKKHEKMLAKKKTEEEIDRENGQLDNLFLTLRESIVQNIEEAHVSNKTVEHKKDHHSNKAHGKKKHHHKKKAPKSTQMLQLDSDIQMEAASLQQTHMKSGVKSHLRNKQKVKARARDDDMSPDEMADVELAAMAHNAIGQQRKEQNMLNQARNPYADLVQQDEVTEHKEQSETGSLPISSDESTTTTVPIEIPTEQLPELENPKEGPASDHQVNNPSSSSFEHPDVQDVNAILTGVPSNSEESKALARQQNIEAAAEQREREMSGQSQSHSSQQDINSDPAGEVAVEHHFEDSSLRGALESIETEQTLQRAEYREPPRVESHQDEPEFIGGDQHQQDKEIQQAIDNINNEQNLRYLEQAALPQVIPHKPVEQFHDEEFLPHQAIKITKQFMDEHDMEGTLQSLEGTGYIQQEQQHEDHTYGVDAGNVQMRNLMDEVSDASFVQTHSVVHQGPPRSVSLLQVDSQVEASAESQAQAQAQAYAQAQSRVAMRAKAQSQAEAAVEALSALGIQQKSQIQTQDQNLINALKRTIGQLEAKKHPGVAAAEAKKKAVNNIQKSLTKKILNRLDDSQPLINVFSKMQSLSKMMPQIEDFERRLNILHQVEPILENAINTLSKVVDLNSALPAAPAPKPKPKPKKAAAATPDLGQLKALLANAQAAQAAPAEPAEDDTPDLSGLLGGGSGLESLLGGAAAADEPAAEEPAPEVDASADDLSGLLGGGGGDGTADLLSKLLG